LKGCRIFAAEEWAQRKWNKKIIFLIVDHVSDLKYKFTYEDKFTVIVCVENWKRFKKDFAVSSATMSLWIAVAGGDFLKDKLAHKNKNKETPAELVTKICEVLQHCASIQVGDCLVQFCPFDKQKFHKFVN
jgi:hypothetical protein